MAIHLAGMQCSPDEDDVREGMPDENSMLWIQDLVVYRTSGFQQLARISFGTAEPVIHWSISGGLYVAQQPELSNTRPSVLTMSGAVGGVPEPTFVKALAFAWDAGSRTAIRSFPSSICPDFQSLPKDGWRRMAWSASGQHLLIHEQQADSNAAQAMGWLTICDLTAGNIAIQCRVPFTTKHHGHRQAASWHPGLHGVIFASSVGRTHVTSLQQAGFAAGALPDGLLIHQAGFSSDARYLIARAPKTTTPWESIYHVLRCSIDGLQITFDVEHRLDCVSSPGWQARRIEWLPSTYSLFIMYREGNAPYECLVHQVNPASAVHSKDVAALSYTFLSPSSSWFLHMLPFGFSIYEVGTGMKIWDSVTSDPQWSGPQDGPRYPAEYDLFVTQIACHIDRQNTLQICGWLPSGVGFLCSTSQCTNFGDRRPPALHVYRFA